MCMYFFYSYLHEASWQVKSEIQDKLVLTHISLKATDGTRTLSARSLKVVFDSHELCVGKEDYDMEELRSCGDRGHMNAQRRNNEKNHDVTK
jgi:hypothetical protein